MHGEVRAVDDVAAAFCDLVVEESPETIALSGGGTAERCYAALRERPFDWTRVTVLFGDERDVTVHHEDSNEGMARRVLLDHVQPAAIHSMVGIGAREYDSLVRSMPPVDLVHLGLGPDGHTASLFPGAPSLAVDDRFVIDAAGDVDHPHDRITFTFPAIARSQLVVVTVEGSSKREAWERLVRGDDVPAQHVTATRVVWLVERSLFDG
ncbi:MAG TPA: 6-phosphogluconolactonase [Acidimicrobiales bacterium]|nr:6-phosphogluconolactonase [Acidimicrobiales bacterium]